MTKQKSLYEQIQEFNGSQDEPIKQPKCVEDLLKAWSNKPIKLHQIWAGIPMFEKLREMGDDVLYDLIQNCEIVTDTKGAKYIEDFLEEYES